MSTQFGLPTPTPSPDPPVKGARKQPITKKMLRSGSPLAKPVTKREASQDEFYDSDESGATKADRQMDETLSENPFDSVRSKILFDAIDQLQSCGAGQLVDIPQLVIVGAQSSGKSALLQSLTDIPFPVGKGTCTRFVTRIVSRPTPPGTQNAVKISIVPPDIDTSYFGYPEDDTYKQFEYRGETLGQGKFREIVAEVSAEYMGIKLGKGPGTKNFATEVLKIELSGPKRSPFSILDIPGIFTNDVSVNNLEMEGIQKMTLSYLQKPENIVICVADCTSDVFNSAILTMGSKYGDKHRMVGVFTKCDIGYNVEEIVAIVTGKKDAEEYKFRDWFVVRNRTEADGDDFDLKETERQLFSKAPWSELREDRRGSAALKRYLGDLLCAKICDRFPVIQAKVEKLQRDAESTRAQLGDARSSHNIRLQFLMNVIKKYEKAVLQALEEPGFLPQDSMRVRGKVNIENQKFTTYMREKGHLYEFEDSNTNPDDLIERALKKKNQNKKLQPTTLPLPETPLSAKTEAVPKVFPVKSRDDPKPTKELFDTIKKQVSIFQSNELPGMINTDVLPVIYRLLTEKWQRIAEDHLREVARHTSVGAYAILDHVCPRGAEGFEILREELRTLLQRFHDQAVERSFIELRTYCERERSTLQTTDSRFLEGLQKLRTARLSIGVLAFLENLSQDDLSNAKKAFQFLHPSVEENMVFDIHDLLKVYYSISIESFIRHITNIIVEGFVSQVDGPLKRLSSDYVLGLSEAEVERLARDDDATVIERAKLDSRIQKLRTALEISQSARAKALAASRL